ncbi:hypothetical protein ACGFNP_00065 [Nonomuraea sp. NPDC049269]|uniref:hypothetical protein n=1 Tax=Nonomuraea sp. NPDC049269 TaxID=3364349 RepID=UPI003715FDEE
MLKIDDLMGVVFAGLSALVIEDVRDEYGLIRVMARTRNKPVPCPVCGVPTGRVHGYCSRTATDVPVDGRPVHLIDRALDHPAGHLMDLGLVPQLDELEEGLERLRAGQPGALGRGAQHLAEVHIHVGRLHLPQRPAEPHPTLLELHHLTADRRGGKTSSGPGEHQPGQHVSLKPRDLFWTRRGADLTQISYDCQAQLVSPRLHRISKTNNRDDRTSEIPRLLQMTEPA